MKIAFIYGNIWTIYEKLVGLGLIVLLMGTFCFGRFFSIICLGRIGALPLYVTDVFIVFSFPFACVALKHVFRFSKWFFIPYFLMLMIGSGYLVFGVVFAHNAFACRGVVLSVYLLFVPILLGILDRFKKWDRLLAGIILCNVVGIVIGWITAQASWKFFYDSFTVHARGFNLTLFNCVSLAFLWAYVMESKDRVRIAGAGFLSALNLYLMFVLAVRASWVAFVVLVIFYGIIFFRQWKRAGVFFLMIVIVVIGMMHSRNILNMRGSVHVAKASGFEDFIKDRIVVQHMDQGHIGSTAATALEQNDSVGGRLLDAPVVVVNQPENVLTQSVKKDTELPAMSSPGYGSIGWRIDVWKKAWQEMQSTLIFGKGLGAFLTYDPNIQYLKVSGFAKDSGIVPLHNEILTILYKMGLVGLFFFLWMNGYVFVAGCRMVNVLSGIKRSMLAGMLGSFVAWHVMAQFFDLIDSPPTNIFLWVMMACILVLSSSKDSAC